MREKSWFVAALLLSLILLVGGAARWMSKRDATSRTSKTTSDPSLDKVGSVEEKVEGASGPPDAAPSRGTLSARARFFRVLAKHRGDRWLAERLGGFPFNEDYPPFRKFIDELKEVLGEEAVPTLVGLVGEAESHFFKEACLTLMAGIKDPGAEQHLNEWALDSSMDSRLRGMALYGLAMLKTESAWQTVSGFRERLNQEKGPIPYAYYCALAKFGDRAVPMLVEDATAEATVGKKSLARFVLFSIDAADPRTLEALAKHPVAEVRQGVVAALARTMKADQLPGFLDLMAQEQHPASRRSALVQLNLALRSGLLDMAGAPDVVARLRAAYETFPLDVRLSLLASPALRAELGANLKDFASSPEVETSRDLSVSLAYALAGEPSQHSHLARYFKEGGDRVALYYMKEALLKQGSFSDATLGEAVAKAALDPAAEELHFAAWELLGHGPESLRDRTLEGALRSYSSIPDENSRAHYVSALRTLGSASTPALLSLLENEKSSWVKLEAVSAVLQASRGGGLVVSEERIANTLAPFFHPENPDVARYIVNHPEGFEEGLDTYAIALSDYYSRYGTSKEIPALQKYAELLYVPPDVTGDPERLERIRKKIQQASLQSVDEIRLRDSR